MCYWVSTIFAHLVRLQIFFTVSICSRELRIRFVKLSLLAVVFLLVSIFASLEHSENCPFYILFYFISFQLNNLNKENLRLKSGLDKELSDKTMLQYQLETKSTAISDLRGQLDSLKLKHMYPSSESQANTTQRSSSKHHHHHPKSQLEKVLHMLEGFVLMLLLRKYCENQRCKFH